MRFTVVGQYGRSRSAAALLVGLALVSSGCYKATGGGWIQSIFPDTFGNKANFGFTAHCRNTTHPLGGPGAALYDGQLEWNDGPFRFHGNVEPLDPFLILEGRCQDIRSTLVRTGVLVFGGTYRPKSGGEQGSFVVTVEDLGTPGANGDMITIELFGGEYLGYANAGPLQGGNIQVF